MTRRNKANRLPYFVEQIRADGSIAYHWKPSPRLRREGWTGKLLAVDDYAAAVIACVARNEEVDEWEATRSRGATARAPRKAPITFGEAVNRYLASNKFGALKEKTQREYRSRLSTLLVWADHGATPLAAIDREAVMALRNSLVESPTSSDYRTAALLRVLSAFFSWAEASLLVKDDPTKKLSIPEPPRRTHRLTVDQLPFLLDRARDLDLPHMDLAITLGFFTMQREADQLATTQFAFRPLDDLSAEARVTLAGDDGKVMAIWLRQGKTDTWVAAPLVPLARAGVERAIEQAIDDGSTASSLIQKNGRNVSEKMLQVDFRCLREEAAAEARHRARCANDNETRQWWLRMAEMLEHLQYRDLRRSGMCWLREQGATIPMIAAMSGHSIQETTRILDTYLPRDPRAAAEGMAMALRRQTINEEMAMGSG